MGRAGEGERRERGLMHRQPRISLRSIRATQLALAAVLLLAAAADAQDWPTRPITLVVPFSAGGPVDVAARLIAPRIGESLGQQIVIENMGGAGGMSGANRIAKAAPDGSLFVLGNASRSTIPRPSSPRSASWWRTPRFSSCARIFPRARCPNSSPP
jgi:Tripartite tricarboxylate transporter family receptor